MDLFEEIVRLRREGRRCALATIVHANGSIPSFESSRMLVRDDGTMVGTVGGGCVEAEVWAAAREVLQTEQPRKLVFNLNHDPSYDTGLICGGTLEIFVEPILPVPRLYLFGGGHVSLAVARVAQVAGFEIIVTDDRASFANAERFPMASGFFTSFAEAFEKIRPDASSYLVIATRGHRDDMRVLKWAIATPARYIGMIGSRRKVIAIYRALEKEGIPLDQFARVHAPIGIDIGALTPEEIAVSVVAELIAVRRNATAVPHKTVRIVTEPAHHARQS
jgi:xanthine dehydrogenase accessory factor